MPTSVNPRRSGQPRTAALAHGPELRTRMRAGDTSGNNWQADVIRFDRDGPGVVGYYLDLIQLLSSLCPLRPQVQQRDGTWGFVDDPVLTTILAGYRSNLYSQPELVGLHARHREGVGECWIIWSEEIGWCIATVPNVRVSRGGGFVDFTDPYGTSRRVPRSQVWKSWDPDPYEPWLARSPVRRALPDIRRIHSAVRNQIRTSDSRLLMNGLLAFPQGQGGAAPLADPSAGGPRQGASQVIDDFIDLSHEAFSDDDSPAAHMPFPYEGEKAEWVEIGRGVDGGVLEIERTALEAFARAVNFPAQLLTLGPGSANHWNEWVLQEVQHKMGLAPKLTPVCADITAAYFRPMVERVKGRVGSWDVDPERVRVHFDMSFLTASPDNTGQVIEAWRLGLIEREEAAEKLGIDKPLELPIGLSEFEMWELATGSKGAPYAEVDADNRLILPDLPPEEEDPFAEPEEPEPGVVDAEVVPPPAPTPAAPTPVENRVPPALPPRTAAAEAPGAALLERLVEVDRRLDAQLSGAVATMVTAVTAEVAKEVVKALPPRSPERAALRALPPEQAWVQAPPSARARVDVAEVAQRTLAAHEPTVRSAFDDAAADAADAWADAGWGVPEYLAAIGAAVLLLGITEFVVDAFEDLATAPADVPFDAAKRVLRLRPPASIVRLAVAAAAGARVDATGHVVASAAGTPAAADGLPWEGSTGMATGHKALQRLRETGVPVTFEWMHSFFGRPQTPYPPHLALDGEVFASPSDVPGGLFPGDHAWCRCALVPKVAL